MANKELKEKIKSALKSTYFSDESDFVDAYDGDDDDFYVHVVIVSHKFKGKHLQEKTDLIWSVLTQSLAPSEWGRISLTDGTTPQEITAL